MSSHLSILVTGSRNATNAEDLIFAIKDTLTLHTYDSLTLFVGCAKGADQMARDWWHARNPEHVLTAPEPMVELFTNVPDMSGYNEWNGTPGDDDGFRECCIVFHADWAGLGKSAGPRRNDLMVKAWAEDGGAHYAFAMWTGDTRGSGTLDCMSRVVRAGHRVEVIPC